MAKAHYLSDKDGKFYPYGHTKAIYDKDGKILDTKLGEIENAIPTVTDTYSSTSSDAMSGKAVAEAISGFTGGTIVSPTEPSGQKENEFWMQPYE